MKRKLLLIAAVIFLAALAAPSLLFYIRTPVLVVIDAPFLALYGEKRARRQQLAASAGLFRRVRPVLVADGASPDILTEAVSEASSQPYCVIFQRRHLSAAERYHEQFPEIPAVLLAGSYPVSGLPPPDGFLCVYGADRGTDLYRAGLAAGIISGTGANPAAQDENGGDSPPVQRNCVFWQDRYIGAGERDLFSRGVLESGAGAAAVFVNSAAELPDPSGISCLALSGAGADYFEKSPKTPLLLFTWLDPALVPREVAVMFDDSPLALAAPAARMAAAGLAEGQIPSKPLILAAKTAGRGITRQLKNSVKKTPERQQNQAETLTNN